MTENSDIKKGTLSLGGAKKTLSLKAPLDAEKKAVPEGRKISPRRSSVSVAVEVKKKRGSVATTSSVKKSEDEHLTEAEREVRIKALQHAQQNPGSKEDIAYQTKLVVKTRTSTEDDNGNEEELAERDGSNKEDLRQKELEKLNQINEKTKADRKHASSKETSVVTDINNIPTPPAEGKAVHKKFISGHKPPEVVSTLEDDLNKKRAGLKVTEQQNRRNKTKLTVYQAINSDDEVTEGRTPSMAAQRRAREKQRNKMLLQQQNAEKVKQYREVTLPEIITVHDLANRMTERVGDVVKKLMGMGIMATATQTIDADTAELIIIEFGHTVKRVKDSDIELGDHMIEDKAEDLQSRPPVITIMGHVDHGKTSLLDAIRKTSVVKGEAGGITQHIGAYQIQNEDGKKLTFIDTPGHAAFTEMRARGADVTDIVVLVVAANDSVMPQTVEAISHAKAAQKPVIVAINKCDLPDANPSKVKQELMQYEIFVEDMGGETQCVEVSAKQGMGLKELEEAILVQAEVMDMKANPNRTAIGAVIEARLDHGRGSVATILIQKGTLKLGDIFVTGTETGRVRALINDLGEKVETALPGEPIEVLGLTGTPDAGDDFIVVESDSKARNMAEFRVRKKRALAAAKMKTRGLEQMMSEIKAGEVKNLPIVIKGDVHGSVEAIASSLMKITEENTEVRVQILHSGVGAVTESDITLANASNALVIGFNVRANPQARELAKRDGVEIRYYSIIYEIIDEVKGILSGMLSPETKEKFIGYAEIRQIFNMSKYGKVAGCFVTEGNIKRGAKVRLLRDNVVIHEGVLKSLRRLKDEVREVQKGFECGMAFENYEDLKEGDMIEAFEIESTERKID